MSFARFMASPLGRGIRIVAGAVMIIAGLVMGGGGGIALAVVGLLPLLAGVFNICAIAPLLKAPFRGKDLAAKP